MADATTGPYAVARRAGGFFCFTSNVDAHSYDRFPACEIRDCHGNVEVYQCAAQCDAHPRLWRAPREWRFRVDLETMLARPGVVDGDAGDLLGPAARARAATYAALTFKWRAKRIASRDPVEWGDLQGPLILGTVVLLFLTSAWVAELRAWLNSES